MTEVGIYNRQELKDRSLLSLFQAEVLDFMIEHEWHEILIDEDNEWICTYGGQPFSYREFLQNSEKVKLWLALNARYNDGER